MKDNKIPLTDDDFIELFADKLRKDNSLFEQQAMIINSQIIASRSLFKNKFAKELKNGTFKEAARKFLREAGVLKDQR